MEYHKSTEKQNQVLLEFAERYKTKPLMVMIDEKTGACLALTYKGIIEFVDHNHLWSTTPGEYADKIANKLINNFKQTITHPMIKGDNMNKVEDFVKLIEEELTDCDVLKGKYKCEQINNETFIINHYDKSGNLFSVSDKTFHYEPFLNEMKENGIDSALKMFNKSLNDVDFNLVEQESEHLLTDEEIANISDEIDEIIEDSESIGV